MSPSDPSVLTVREVAEAFGVSPQRVRRMIGDGVLPARRSSGGWLVPSSVVAQRAERRHRGRPVSPASAWAVIRVLDAGSVDVLPDRRLRHRARGLLSAQPDPVSDADAWRLLLARRGQARRMWGHPGVLDALGADRRVSPADASRVEHDAGLSRGPGRSRLYVRAQHAGALAADFRLRDDPEGNVVLVVVPEGVPDELAPRPGQPVVAPAVVADLLDEPDPRARHAAARRLRSMCRAVAQARG